MGIERRALVTEVRATGRKLTGYAAVFASPAEISGFTETIRSGAFRGTLAAKGDVLALVDHDMTKLLGRTASGTLRLSEDSRGLSFEVDVPPTTLGNDVLAMVERNDIRAMSFGFRVSPDGEVWPDKRTRELRAVELVEVSVVHAFPAYEGTSVQARGRTGIRVIRIPLTPAQRRRFVECL